LFKAVFLPIASLALLVWAIVAAGGLGPILARPSAFQDTSSFLRFFVPGVTGIVGFWATLSLNIPDFTRFAESQRAHRIGQSIALPAAMAAFAFVGVVVTSASAVRFGKVIWDPLALAARIESPLIIAAVMVLVAVSTLATNIAANIVSPANDFANLAPSLISFRTGGYMTAVIGALIMPWKLIADPSGYIFTWLIAYSSLLGPIAGIMITDYYGVRRRDLVVEDLYRRGGAYWYVGGFNPAALVAFVAGVSPCVPGFLVTAGLLSSEAVPGWLGDIYRYAWFVGFGVAAIVYWVLTPRQTQSPARQVDSLTRA
jgi:NCS1 family nucleobase:cation symporter-1